MGDGSAEALIVKLAKLEGNICRLPAPYVWSIPIAIVVMMLFSSRIRFGKARRKAFAAALCALALSYLPRFAPDARYVQLDVGQGDAAILRHGRGMRRWWMWAPQTVTMRFAICGTRGCMSIP